MASKKLLAAALLVASSFQANAIDLGVHANIWSIGEMDMRKHLAILASKVDWEAINEKAVERSKNYLNDLPTRNLPTVDKTTTFGFKPSIILKEDIKGPLPNEKTGKLETVIVEKAGTEVNPLERGAMLTTPLFFYNGKSEAQFAFAKKLRETFGEFIYLIETSGSPEQMIKDTKGTSVFFASDFELKQFRVTAVPSLIYHNPAKFPDMLLRTTFAEPFSVDEFKKYWKPIAMINAKQTENQALELDGVKSKEFKDTNTTKPAK